MRKLLVLITLGLFLSMGTYAQKNKRTSAFMYNKNQQYDKAMQAIDEAIANPKTEKDAKTWMYRGIIYYNIAYDTTAKVQALAPKAADIAVESFAKSKELDEKKTFQVESAMYLLNLTNLFFQKGADSYNAAEYNSAIKNFKQAFDIAKMDGRFDTIAALYIGKSGFYSEQPEVTAEYMKKCIDVNLMDPQVYLFYSRSQKLLGDTTQAFEVIAKGREIFPNESSLQLEEAQLFLETGNNDKLINSLKEAIAADPENPNLYRVCGQTYENIGDDTNALVYYVKAVELDPSFKDAIFNIGAIYVNRASALYDVAKNLSLEETEKYDKMKGEADKNLEMALPYLEKSLELNPGDEVVIGALKEAYANLRMNDKLKELMEQNK